MHTTYASPSISLVQPFQLISSRSGKWSKQVVALYWVIVFPFMLAGICLYYLLALRNAHFLIAMTLVLLILLNLYFFFIRHQGRSGSWSLQIDLGEIQLLHNEHVLHRELLKNLRIDQLNWGQDAVDPLPVIRIEGAHFPKLYIASAPARNFRAKLRKIQEAADYQVISVKEWQRLVQVLAVA